MVLEGEDAIKAARQVIGATNPLEATTGSIRGDYAIAGRHRTWSTAPTRPSPASARPALFFPASDPRLAARRSGRRSSTQLGIAYAVEPADVEELTEGDPTQVALENARRKAGGRPDTLGVDTLVAARRPHLRQAGRRRPRPATTLLALSDRTHAVVSGLVLRGTTASR